MSVNFVYYRSCVFHSDSDSNNDSNNESDSDGDSDSDKNSDSGSIIKVTILMIVAAALVASG